MTKSREQLKEDLISTVVEAEDWLENCRGFLHLDPDGHFEPGSLDAVIAERMIKIEANNLILKNFLFEEFGIYIYMIRGSQIKIWGSYFSPRNII